MLCLFLSVVLVLSFALRIGLTQDVWVDLTSGACLDEVSAEEARHLSVELVVVEVVSGLV